MKPSVSEKSEISFATRRKVYHKRSNKQANRLVQQELELTKKLTQRSTQSPAPKDDDILYRELLLSNLRKLSEMQKFQAKHKI